MFHNWRVWWWKSWQWCMNLWQCCLCQGLDQLNSQWQLKQINISFRLGYNVALHPRRTIFFTLMVLAVTSMGFFKLQFEQNALKTFVAAGNYQHMFDSSSMSYCMSLVLQSRNFPATHNGWSTHPANQFGTRVSCCEPTTCWPRKCSARWHISRIWWWTCRWLLNATKRWLMTICALSEY